MNGINPFQNFPGVKPQQAVGKAAEKQEGNTPSFKETLQQMLSEINDEQAAAKESVQKFLNGEIEDVHQVMIAAEKAGIGLEMTMEIRNKIIEAYREVMRMSG